MFNPKKAEEIIRQFFEKMTFEAAVEVSPQVDNSLPVRVKTDDPQILIGQGGETLAEIQRLLRMVLLRQAEALGEAGDFYVDLDINEYKEKKIKYLKEMAKEAADDVALMKKEKELPPMPAYERRIVHLALAGRTDVVAESVGEEPERRVVIGPAVPGEESDQG